MVLTDENNPIRVSHKNYQDPHTGGDRHLKWTISRHLGILTSILRLLSTEFSSDMGSRMVNENRSAEAYDCNHPSMARMALKNTALTYLMCLNESELTQLALQEYKSATNMTEQLCPEPGSSG
ncbi:hypothetical protein V2J09_006470 [Rumex salicifolius]